jgi:uncharacterized SAM-binding protein YcdF (DUF218 family)
MFLLKKIVGTMFLPLPVCLVILILGVVILWFSRKQRLGKTVVTLGTVLLLILSFNLTSSAILAPLENAYPPILNPAPLRDVKWIVVLSGGHISDPRVPITSRIGGSTLVRLVEGIRLHRLIPGSRLLLSGSGVFDPESSGRIMADMAVALGVDRSDLVLEEDSRDTYEQALCVKKIVGRDRFILVTRAAHMPRSVALFRKQGMDPIPAPTEHMVKTRENISSGIFFPLASNLEMVESAVHEYMGLLWGKMRGQID